MYLFKESEAVLQFALDFFHNSLIAKQYANEKNGKRALKTSFPVQWQISVVVNLIPVIDRCGFWRLLIELSKAPGNKKICMFTVATM